MDWTRAVGFIAALIVTLVAFGAALSLGGLLAGTFLVPVAVVMALVAVSVGAMVVLGRGEAGGERTPYW